MKASTPDGDLALNPGDILLFYNARGINRLISLLTHSPYYHVGLSAGGTNIIEARPMGVELNALGQRRGGNAFVRIPAPDAAGAAAAAWARTQVGDGYDRAGAVEMVFDRMFVHFHINKVTGDRYTCGELVAVAYQHAGHLLFPDIEAQDVEPADYARFIK